MTHQCHFHRNRVLPRFAGWHALRSEGHGFPMLHAVGSSGSATQRVGCCLAVVLLSLSLVAESRAADMFWNHTRGDGSGTFSVASYWTGPVSSTPPPDDNDVAHFGLTTSILEQWAYTIQFTADATNEALVVEDDLVTFDLNDHVYTATESVPITIGTVAGRTGGLTITDGIVAVTSANSSLLLGDYGPGFLTVTTGGLLAGPVDIYVGIASPTSTLTVNNNGDIIADNVTIGCKAAGTATITGGGSSLLAATLTVARGVTGTLNITAGGKVDSSSGLIADFSGGTGVVTVDGPSSRWRNDVDLIVGDAGDGTLNIKAGGVVENHRNGFIGHGADATGIVTVDGATSQWINSSVLQVGFLGHGELNITGGARVQNSESNVGVSEGSSGIALVRGSTWTNTSSLNVGFEGEGVLMIEAGGSVSSVGGSVGALAGSNGTAPSPV